MVTIAIFVACCLAAPLAVLGTECWLSLLPLRRHKVNAPAAPIRIAIVVPANNEEDRIAATVRCIQAQAGESATIIVIADNCEDATADRASAAGAIVWKRFDSTRRGKGYALNFAIERLSECPPDVVICIDADCVTGPACIETLARLASHYQRPVQAAYVMHAPASGEGLSSTSAFAVYVKNVARPRGLQRLGLPCMVNGSGMAFPWTALRAVRFADAHITEDCRISGDLAKADLAPIPCMEVYVSSDLPATRAGFISQRTRWEHGHLATMLRVIPPLLLAFIKRPRLQILGILLELSVPPLSLMVFNSGIIILILAGLSYGIGSWLPLLSYLTIAIASSAGLITVWLCHGRNILSPWRALQIPRYALTKAPMYLRFITRRQREWIRTERPSPISSDPFDLAPSTARSAILPHSSADDRR